MVILIFTFLFCSPRSWSAVPVGKGEARSADAPTVIAPPPGEQKLHPFYQQYLDYRGLPIVASERVAPKALFEAQRLVHRMLGERPDIAQEIANQHVKLAIMSATEVTTDIPEHSDLTPKEYWDNRARGLGATHVRPAVSAGEENLLGLKGDKYRGESILIHEFAHVIHEMGLNGLNADFDARLRAVYERAMEQELWKNTYAATNHKEYWAEGVQCWFDANLEASPANGIHNEVNTRDELVAYDPELARLIAEELGESTWRYAYPSQPLDTRVFRIGRRVIDGRHVSFDKVVTESSPTPTTLDRFAGSEQEWVPARLQGAICLRPRNDCCPARLPQNREGCRRGRQHGSR